VRPLYSAKADMTAKSVALHGQTVLPRTRKLCSFESQTNET